MCHASRPACVPSCCRRPVMLPASRHGACVRLLSRDKRPACVRLLSRDKRPACVRLLSRDKRPVCCRRPVMAHASCVRLLSRDGRPVMAHASRHAAGYVPPVLYPVMRYRTGAFSHIIPLGQCPVNASELRYMRGNRIGRITIFPILFPLIQRK